MVLTKSNQKEWEEALAKKLFSVFGKCTFTEAELTKEFYVELNIRCNEFFKTEDGMFDLDLFWAEGFKEWLLSEK